MPKKKTKLLSKAPWRGDADDSNKGIHGNTMNDRSIVDEKIDSLIFLNPSLTSIVGDLRFNLPQIARSMFDKNQRNLYMMKPESSPTKLVKLRELERGVNILVATPRRLNDLLERARVSQQMIRFLALDEADRMLGIGFEQQIRKILEHMDMPPCDMR